ncbi:hypothetical protein [Janthinobacterium psychrotolerans]|uniref:Uncharacterized protein n=1 Tax=Janthinobacterium psychrotolerans TaxID=1747903 RepID=A0A1A7C7I5_9BURK|nr:hypothetical protein [Janthinobacterium psychrotolerans]OBV40984.1 hypothetical protein ASR47_102227 [Janthinobacterium psychrotolerans]
MKQRLLASLAAHALACVLFLLLLWLGFAVREHWWGALPASGVVGALTLALLFYAVAGANLLLVLLPHGRIKPLLCVALALAILACFLPEHPWRALYYSAAAAGASWLGVLGGRVLERRSGARRAG